MNHSDFTVSYRWVLIAAALYLILPNILFLGAWLTPWAAMVAIAALLGGCFYFRAYFLKEKHSIHLSRKDLWSLLGVSLLLLLLTEGAGFNLHVYQGGDFIVRTPIYESLVREPWPLYSARNEYFVYYLSYWLVPAGLAKVCSFVSPEWWLFWWSYLGMALAGLVAFTRLRGRVILLVVGILFLALILTGGNLRSCMNNMSLWHMENSVFYGVLECVNKHRLYYPAGWQQIYNTFNHAIPMLVFMAFCLMPRLPFALLLFLSAMVVPVTPLGAISLLPLLFVRGVRALKINSVATCCQSCMAGLFAAPLLLVSAAYFSLGSGTIIYFIWQNADYSLRPNGEIGEILLCLAFLWGNFCLLFFCFGGRFRNKELFAVMLSTAVICSLVWVGCPWNNELLFKGSLVPYVCIGLLFALRLCYKCPIWMFVLAGCCLLSTARSPYYIFRSKISSYTWDPLQMQTNKSNEWKGTLNHPEDFIYAQFWAVKKPSPAFFKVRDDMRLFSEE